MIRRHALSAILLISLSACGQAGLLRRASSSAVPVDWPVQQQQQLREFDQMVIGLRENYIEREKTGSSWQKQTDSLRAKFNAKTTADDYAGIVADLLATLKDPSPFIANSIADDPALAATPNPGTPTYAGIGVLVDLPSASKQRILVLTVLEGSPAQTAGIKPHDAIVAVDGRPVGDDLTILGRVRGPVNSKVEITIKTPGQAQRDLSLTRKPIPRNSPTVARLLAGSNYGYILPSTTVDAARMRDDWIAALRKLATDRALDGLILDLRTMRNTEFPLSDALSLFVNGHVANKYIRDSAGLLNRANNDANKLQVQGRNVVDSQRVPLVILVSEFTDGQAESFAGVLQSLGRAVVIGNTTPGRSVEYFDVDLPLSDARLRVPNSDYRSLKGEQWFKHGVRPNPLSTQLWEEFNEDNDAHLKLALESLGKR